MAPTDAKATARPGPAAAGSRAAEHLDLDRLPALEHAVFGFARPLTVIVTTPNVEHNVRYPDLPAGAMRHRDHRFEWTRDEFATWSGGVAGAHGYDVRLQAVGADDVEVGPPTQMAVLTRTGETSPVDRSQDSAA